MKRKDPKFKYASVMLLDDSDLDNFINQKTIEAHHFAKTVHVNTCAEKALEMLEKPDAQKQPESCPDVIFIDLNMPLTDGFQFIERFKELSGRLAHQPKLAILTSSVSFDDRQKARNMSEDILFLNKPLTKEMLEKI